MKNLKNPQQKDLWINMVDRNRLSSTTQILYSNYGFATDKINRLQHKDPYYKYIVQEFIKALTGTEFVKLQRYKLLAPYLEQLRYDNFQMLVEMHELGVLDDFVNFIKRTPK